MFIKFEEIFAYYLNRDIFIERRGNMENMLLKLKMNYERIPSNTVLEPRQNGMSVDLMTLIKTAINNDKYPFIIFEDDASIIDIVPEVIDIPEEADLIYLGGSLYNCGGKKLDLRITDYNDEYYRILSSLGGHAIVVPHRKGADIILKAFSKSLENNEYTDLGLAIASEKYLFLTPKNGMYFYQNDAHTIPVTNFKWNDVKSNLLL
jgi:hypothetical protein